MLCIAEVRNISIIDGFLRSSSTTFPLTMVFTIPSMRNPRSTIATGAFKVSILD